MLMQGTAVQQPTPLTAPAAPAAPALTPLVPTTITFTGIDGTTETLRVPATKADIAEIRAQRRELSSQLTSAEDRRHRLSEELNTTPNSASRSGLEQRITVLDKRIVQLESDIAATGRQISAAPEGLTTSTGPQDNGDMPENVTNVAIVFTIFVFFPLAIAISRLIWRKATKMGTSSNTIAQLPVETGQRLERLEQGVEAIAIEIERVAEGQRFVTRLLSEAKTPEKIGVARD